MLRDLELLVKIQGMDQRATDLRKEIAELPRHIAIIERTLESHTRKLEADHAHLAANQKERRSAESEIQIQNQKISKLRDQMMGSKITNDQYRAFQHEIDYCQNAIRKFEDRILELMLDSESLEQLVKASEASLKAEKELVEKEKALARDRTAADQKQLDELIAERKTLTPEINAPLLNQYERLAKRGVAVSDATKGRCSACHLELRPQLFQDLRKGDKVFLCENCNRILYYNPPVDFDPELGGPVHAGGTRVDMS